ncbi:MAG: matrixin family metalloprotease, partial [Gaiellaceae bacterium]
SSTRKRSLGTILVIGAYLLLDVSGQSGGYALLNFSPAPGTPPEQSIHLLPENYGTTLSVVCEEIGHSVGLAHSKTSDPGYTSSCMWASTNDFHLTSHDKQVINNHY